MFKRRGGKMLPLGNKPRGQQRVERGARTLKSNGPTAQQSIVGTTTVNTPGVFSSAAGGAGYRTLEAPERPNAQPVTFGFFTPFAMSGSPWQETMPEVPFAIAPKTTAAPQTPAPAKPAPASRAMAGRLKAQTPKSSAVFAPPRTK